MTPVGRKPGRGFFRADQIKSFQLTTAARALPLNVRFLLAARQLVAVANGNVSGPPESGPLQRRRPTIVSSTPSLVEDTHAASLPAGRRRPDPRFSRPI